MTRQKELPAESSFMQKKKKKITAYIHFTNKGENHREGGHFMVNRNFSVSAIISWGEIFQHKTEITGPTEMLQETSSFLLIATF